MLLKIKSTAYLDRIRSRLQLFGGHLVALANFLFLGSAWEVAGALPLARAKGVLDFTASI